MKKLSLFLICWSLFLQFVSAQRGDEPSGCVDHLCTAQLLACPTGNLAVDKNGCKLCRCEESTVARVRTCQLHGCTVGMLKCAGELKRNEHNCTLCQCDEQGVRAPDSTQASSDSDICPTLNCNLECKRLQISPNTGCPVCECDRNVEDLDLCPKAQEINSAEGLSRGANNIVPGSNVPKYKILLGKLKRGFNPTQSHKVILKALDNNFPFKEFLLEILPTPHVVVKSRRRRGRNRKMTLLAQGDQNSDRKKRKSTCGSGYWAIESSNASSAGWRPFPDCTTAATETNKTENKTSLTLTWVAPPCGCVYIRASVIDYSGSKVYYDDNSTFTVQAQNSQTRSTGTKLVRPLYRSVCARPTSATKRKGKKNGFMKKKNRRVKQKNRIVVRCCREGRKHKGSLNQCQRKAISRVNSLRTRFAVVKRTCKSAFQTCCVLADSKKTSQPETQASPEEASSSRGRASSRREGSRNSGSFNSAVSDQTNSKSRIRNRMRNNGNGNRRRQNPQQRKQRKRRKFRYRH